MAKEPRIIVVGTDYSAHADRALRAAYEHARKESPTELHVVHALLPAEEYSVASLGEEKFKLVRHLDALVASIPGHRETQTRVIAHVILEAPMLALTTLASDLEASLIVVGTHGRSGVARWLLGSVAEGVVRHAACPVLIIPPEQDALKVPSIAPPCPQCVAARQASAGQEMWCAQHREHHGRRHTYHQADRVGTETNMPLVVR